MPKPIEIQLVYKKVISFDLNQKRAFEGLKKHNVNLNEFIRIAVKEKIKRDWKNIKEKKQTGYCPF